MDGDTSESFERGNRYKGEFEEVIRMLISFDGS